MSNHEGLRKLTAGEVISPFTKTRALLEGITPGLEPAIDLTLGEPRESAPAFIANEIEKSKALFEKYPAMRGADELRTAIAAWLTRRYALDQSAIDPQSHILPCNGSREGLFYACLPAVGRKTHVDRPAVLMCNPYYAAYIGAAFAANAEPVYLPATKKTGFFPDLDALANDGALLRRTAAFYLCSPSNPQGAIASHAYLARAIALAREHDFLLFCDECYSEFYNEAPPPGGLQVAAQTSEQFSNVVVFNSLSKRSNLPGLRSGFCAGDPKFLETLLAIRNLVAPQMAGPTQMASAAAWADEAHVERNRAAFRAKFDICDAVLGTRFGYERPAGGFFLWLDTRQFGGGDQAAVTLWKHGGVRVLPGAFLAQPDPSGANPGADYVRVALVRNKAEIRSALERIVSVFA